MRSFSRINRVYGVRFLEMYADKFNEEDRNILVRTLEARFEKADAVYEAEKLRADYEFKDTSWATDRQLLEGTRRSLKHTTIAVPLIMHFLL